MRHGRDLAGVCVGDADARKYSAQEAAPELAARYPWGARRQPVTASRITRICITHFHGDHCLGLPGVLARMSLDRVPHPVDACYPAQHRSVVVISIETERARRRYGDYACGAGGTHHGPFGINKGSGRSAARGTPAGHDVGFVGGADVQDFLAALD